MSTLQMQPGKSTTHLSGASGLVFDGTTYIQLSGLIPSSRGFSIEFEFLPVF